MFLPPLINKNRVILALLQIGDLHRNGDGLADIQ
jgi:hypothetical protein